MLDTFFDGWPCALAHSESKGRYLTATRRLGAGEVVLVSDAYVSAILSSHKKRVCAFCHQDCRRRLSLCCGGCHQAHWCSQDCRVAHAAAPGSTTACLSGQLSCLGLAAEPAIHNASSATSPPAASSPLAPATRHGLGGGNGGGPEPGLVAREPCDRRQLAPLSAAAIPHGLLCGVLRQFGSVKWSSDVESVLLGVLQVLAMERLEGQGQAAAGDGQRPAAAALEQSAAAGAPPAPVGGCGEAQGGPPAGGGQPGASGVGRGREAGSPPQGAVQQGREAPGGLAEQQDPVPAHPSLPCLGHADFMALQTHDADWDPQERADWLKYAGQLRRMLRKAGWPGQLPSPERVLALAGRITSNNFGIYAPPGYAPPGGAAQAPEPPQLEEAEGGSEQRGARAGGPGPGGCGEATAAAAPAAVAPGQAAGGAGPAQQRQGERPHREELIGRELYITASFFNHSCAPNCVVQRGFKRATVVTKQAVEAGEQLTISYCDLELPRSARQHHLQRFFHFDCDCPRCEREAVEGSAPVTFALSKGKTCAPKKRGRKARVSR